MTYTEFFLDSARGVFLPRDFAESIDIKDWTGISTEDFDGIVLDFIRESTDAYITGTGLAYIATDAVWYAVASVKDLQDAIDSEVSEDM